jgi:hypothetical protein
MPDTAAISPPPTVTLPAEMPLTAADRRGGQLVPAIKELTERHFPEGPVDVELEFDPEVPSDEFFVFSVTASGAVEQIVARECQWHREIHKLAPDEFDAFRLSVREIK